MTVQPGFSTSCQGMRILTHNRAKSLNSLLHKSGEGLLSVLFPTRCPLCGAEVLWSRGIGICASCQAAIRPWRGAICAKCGLPIAAQPPSDNAPLLCGVCRGRGYHFDIARSYGTYTHPLRDLILHLKFHRRERWGWRLGELLAPAALGLQMMASAPLIVPVPLHPTRERERGYNQAALLARGLQHKLRTHGSGRGILVEMRMISRDRPTTPQSGLHHGARRENVRGAFRAERRLAAGRSIILVDDVMTTGATASACAAALKRAGAREVAVLTLARATPQFPDVHPFLLPVDDPPGVRT